AVESGVSFVMVSLATYELIDGTRVAAFSPTIVSGLLRDGMAYRGVIISDALGATAVASIEPATRAVEFIEAGGDLIISNQVGPAIEMAQALASRAAEHPAFAARIDDAALRVLLAKEALGLLPCSG